MRPQLPRKVNTYIDRISCETWNRLIDCLAYAMSHPRGDSRTIRNSLGDILTVIDRTSPGSAGSMSGLFRVSLDDNQLVVGPGFVNRNGLDFQLFNGGSIPAANGYLCICSEPDDKSGHWTDIALEIRELPTQCAYPIAKITSDNNGVAIEQYPVTVAVLVYSVFCPLAEL